jgi:hypothetical protein
MSDEVLDPTQQSWLQQFIRDNGGIAGTVHRRSGPDELALAAAVNIPEPVKNIVRRVPRGKGMAGLALDRNAPISTCNIKTDSTGNVRPGAKAVDAQAAVAMPVPGPDGQVRAVVGIAFMQEKELSDAELAALTEAAKSLP